MKKYLNYSIIVKVLFVISYLVSVGSLMASMVLSTMDNIMEVVFVDVGLTSVIPTVFLGFLLAINLINKAKKEGVKNES